MTTFRITVISIFAKNMDDPHYEPTIVVHDYHINRGCVTMLTLSAGVNYGLPDGWSKLV